MSYYDILEVSVNASKEVIKNAYRALSKKYHPDRNKENASFAEEKLKEINMAYETLIDDEKRLQYDYDNGFKIDPNAIIEEPENEIEEYEEKEDEKPKDKSIWIIKKKNVLIGIVITVAFFLAFIIGIKLANKDMAKKEKNEQKIHTTTNDTNKKKENNTTNNNNSNYNYNYTSPNNNQVNNNTTPKVPNNDYVENNSGSIEDNEDVEDYGQS